MSNLSENEKLYISKITPDNAYGMLKAVYEEDPEFDEIFDRLPIPLSNDGIIKETIRLDRGLGFTKLDGYKPEESITYRLLTDPAFFSEQSKKLDEYKRVWELWSKNQESGSWDQPVDYSTQIKSTPNVCGETQEQEQEPKAGGGGAGVISSR